MYYSSVIVGDVCNGSGIGVSLFPSGCTMACKGCFNKAAWNFNYGQIYTDEIEMGILKALSNPYINHLSILGGHALETKNFDTIYKLCVKVKLLFPEKDTWLWSGYTLEEIQQHLTYAKIMDTIDVLVDGTYKEELRDTTLQWRGSSNQRVLFKGEDF